MEPLAALSVAAAVAQFIDFSCKIVGHAREIHDSASGATEENRSLEEATREMQRLTERLASLVPGSLDATDGSDEERMLNKLVTECRSLSDQLLTLLDRSKAKKNKSKLHTLQAALRSKFHEGERLRLQRRLDDCQLRLERLLTVLSRSGFKEDISNVILSVKANARELPGLLALMKELDTRLTSVNHGVQEKFHDLLQYFQDVHTKKAQREVLDMLAFDGMRQRIETVEDAHCDTFKWIFNDKSEEAGSDKSGSSDAAARAKADSFVEWLSSGAGVYHIAGKLGSGKSTLMKYLGGHPRVREELQKWAGDKELVLASFFFWRRGAASQRSLNGLIRTLLHDILQQRPDLIPEVVPDLWSDAVACFGRSECQDKPFGQGSRSERPDSASFIHATFSRLLQCNALHDNSRVCLFIDGLDEYEERVQDDYMVLVQLLLGWTKSSPNGVKLCVSSREYNIFTNFFSEDKRLRLQELTLADMERYVHDRLRDLEPDVLDRLVDTITAKADGIFLWVALVVKSVRARLEDGFGLSTVEEEVNSLPDELEGLFQHLIESIRKPYRKRAYQTFAMTEMIRTKNRGQIPLPLSLLAYSFLEEYNVDQEFAQKSHPITVFESVSTTSIHDRQENARKKLNALCQGLLEADQNHNIVYTHRSVPEFLEKYLSGPATSMLADFDPCCAIAQLALAELRARPGDTFWVERMEDWVRDIMITPATQLVRGVIALRKMRGIIDSPPCTFLMALDHAAKLAFPARDGRQTPAEWNQVPETGGLYMLPRVTPEYITLFAAAMHGNSQFVDWKITLEPGLIAKSGSYERITGDLFRWATGMGMWYPDPHPEPYKLNPFTVLRVMLRRGLSLGTPVWKAHLATMETETIMNAWQYFMCVVICCAERTGRTGADQRDCGEAMQILLEHGANPELRISLEEARPHRLLVQSAVDKTKRREWTVEGWRLQGASEHADIGESRGGLPHPAIKITFEPDTENAKDIAVCAQTFEDPPEDRPHREEKIRFWNWVVAKDNNVPFKDIVEYCDFPNKQTILRFCSSSRESENELPPASGTGGENDSSGPVEDEQHGKVEQPEQSLTPSQPTPESPLQTSEQTEQIPTNGLTLQHKTQPQILYRQLLEIRVVGVTLAVLAALAVSRLLQVLV